VAHQTELKSEIPKIPQYGLARILKIWAAAVPMGILGWSGSSSIPAKRLFDLPHPGAGAGTGVRAGGTQRRW
jgi:hypothetical protein